MKSLVVVQKVTFCFDYYRKGTTTVTLTPIDARSFDQCIVCVLYHSVKHFCVCSNNNGATCSFNVVVVDQQAPGLFTPLLTSEMTDVDRLFFVVQR